MIELPTKSDVANSIAPIEDLDDDDLGRDVSLSNNEDEENAKEDEKRRLLTEELKEELRSMEEMQESLVREVVLRGR